MREIANKYYQAGLSIIPIGENRIPVGSWKDNQLRAIEPDNRFEACNGIGLCCGGEKHVVAIDIDCKYDLTGKLFADYKALINQFAPELLKKLTVQKTVNGGYHFIFTCQDVNGNKKLANRPATSQDKEGEKVKTLIETREQGGYIMLAPSQGYEIIYGDVCNLQELTPEEKLLLYTCAKTFNTYHPEIKDYNLRQIDDVSPFEDYNNRGDIVTALKECGWTERGIIRGNIMLLRPGGDKLWSAGYHPEMKIFKCFSQSTEFDTEKGYLPSSVLTMVKFGGDYSQAAKWLYSKGFGTQHKKKEPKTIEPVEIEKLLLGSAINTDVEVDRPPTILSVVEQRATESYYKRLFTLGNFSCLTGKAKAKKTFLLTLLTAALLRGGRFQGLYSEIPEGKNLVLFFDTEQGSYDSYNTMKRIETLAETKANFRPFNLRQHDPLQRCEIIEYALQLWGKQSCICIIDGIADLATGINDEEEATRVVTFLLRLTKQYNIHITTVIHQNKNDNFATGHLGSSVMKKAEIIIAVAKNSGNSRISDVKNEMGRGVDFEPFSIYINDDGLPEMRDYKNTEKSHDEVPF